MKVKAHTNRKSLSSEARAILATLRDRSSPLTPTEIDKLRVRGRRPLTDAILEHARRNR